MTMKTAVCMKYVPVIARMQFDYEAKTIMRDGVPSEVNAFDQLGLVRAVELKSSPDDEVVVLTITPSFEYRVKSYELLAAAYGLGGGNQPT